MFRTYIKNNLKQRWPRIFAVLRSFYRTLLSVRYYLRVKMYRVRWLSRYAQFLCKVQRKRAHKQSASDIVNRACNSGPITPTDFSESVESIQAAYTTITERSVLKGELAGYALNDALRWETAEMLYSFSGLALVLIACAESILQVRPNRLRILELGCGSGALGHLLMRLGVSDYVGIDGNALAGRFSPYIHLYRSRFLFLNLQEPIELKRESGEGVCFDIACSFEVLEHIAESTVDIFLRNMRQHLREGGLFICSASTQDWGDVHVTVRPRIWWLERFKKYGLVEIKSREWENRIARGHPWNWAPERTNVFILRDEKYVCV